MHVLVQKIKVNVVLGTTNKRSIFVRRGAPPPGPRRERDDETHAGSGTRGPTTTLVYYYVHIRNLMYVALAPRS